MISLIRTKTPHWTFWILFALEGISDGKPRPPRISKTTRNRPMCWLGRHVTQLHCLLWLTFVLSWIAPTNGSLTYRPKILCPRQVRLGYMHGGSCFPPVHAHPAFATHALLQSDMTHYALFSKTPKPGALAHIRVAALKDWLGDINLCTGNDLLVNSCMHEPPICLVSLKMSNVDVVLINPPPPPPSLKDV